MSENLFLLLLTSQKNHYVYVVCVKHRITEETKRKKYLLFQQIKYRMPKIESNRNNSNDNDQKVCFDWFLLYEKKNRSNIFIDFSIILVKKTKNFVNFFIYHIDMMQNQPSGGGWRVKFINFFRHYFSVSNCLQIQFESELQELFVKTL